ncbi:Coenzyme F420 hydrogenase/dehydrogenase, beta subunit C-terminal domain [Desulfosarcina sp.]|uniref:Coenzyme F420 hydrogenase/dehydrogenase, beta subunit C-terminal domain n=1 Tax=Desulfosarcina sp. TaxID=2027861 RepID=UPI0029A273CF|nr:Coenzyme F420 hydrogenase/dehydrogenase, beta subunit C-terminal domain [Desulfosarcina sp.]MDX2455334.1 Coenzyme F420 hydrogenase/dehydrogenase, beta subunit C-terminal domain [Desulfosarcina sp.]
MTATVKIDVKESLLASLRAFFKQVLELDPISALFIPQRLPMKNMVMPALVTDPEKLAYCDPLAPAFPLNAARVVARMTRRPTGQKIAVVLRPCEMRAFVELVKLKQGLTDEIVLIGIDCLGAYANKDYFKFVETAGEDSTAAFLQTALGQGTGPADDFQLASACRVCEFFTPAMADIQIGIFGMDTTREILVQANTAKGTDLVAGLNLAEAELPPGRREAIDTLLKKRTADRDALFAATSAATDNIEKLTTYLAHCINCYNCRVACPVCYCKECVFVTDVFDHDPAQYLQWSRRKGAIKMPTDTVFYHLTRLAHMSTACVGCGQCSNACPNDIPVMELFRTVAHQTQLAFDYQAGRALDEKPPLSEFKEDEFQEVVGIN